MQQMQQMQQVRRPVETRQRAATPRETRSRSRTQNLDDAPRVDFSTLVGPRTALETVIARWEQLVDAITLRRMVPPRILPLSPAAEASPDAVLRVAVISHPPDLGASLVNGLRNQLPRFAITGVTADRGYFLEPAAIEVNVKPDGWAVTWTPKHMKDLCHPIDVRLPPRALGARFVAGWPSTRKVASIDTGDEGAVSQTGFQLEHSGPEDPVDAHGHGTAVGSLIRLAAPGVEVHSFRVLQRDEVLVNSGLLLNALTEAFLFRYHVVSIPQRAHISIEEQGKQLSLQRIMRQYANMPYPTPVVVCAAGNYGPSERMEYPATVPGVLVARGLTWSGKVADYNCPPPLGSEPYTIDAIGGVENDPLGICTRPGHPSKELYGSSFATSLVTAAVALSLSSPRSQTVGT